MTYHHIIFGIGIIIGLFQFNKTRPFFSKIILLGLVICVLLSFLKVKWSINIAFFGFGLFVMVYMFWSLISKNWLGFISAFLVILVMLFRILHWSFIYETRALLIIPIIWFLIKLRKKGLTMKELSIMTILTSFNLTEFLALFEMWIANE